MSTHYERLTGRIRHRSHRGKFLVMQVEVREQGTIMTDPSDPGLPYDHTTWRDARVEDLTEVNPYEQQ